jgi:hypothetical protein
LKATFLRKNYEFEDVFKCAEKTLSPQISNPEIMKKIGFAIRKYAHLQTATFAEIVSPQVSGFAEFICEPPTFEKS